MHVYVSVLRSLDELKLVVQAGRMWNRNLGCDTHSLDKQVLLGCPEVLFWHWLTLVVQEKGT